MAYKFQLGPAVKSGSLEQEGSINIVDDGSGTFELKVAGTAVVDSSRSVVVGNLFKMPDNTSGKMLVADGTSYQEVAMSGDIAIASNGATTIQADAVESGMLNDNVISGQTELAHADIVDADELMISDGGVLKKVGVDSLRDHYFGVVSGDATVADGGALTIAANAVEGSMLNANVVADTLQYSGSALRLSASVAGAGIGFAAGVLSLDIDELDALGGTGVDQGDHFVFSDGGTEKKITFSNMEDAIFGNVSGDATVAAGGSLTIADNAVTLAKMAGLARGSLILGDANGDPSALATGGAATFLQSDGNDPSYVSISGQATVAAGGALSLAAAAITGQTNMTGDVDDADELMISDGGALKRIDFSVFRDAVFNDVSGDATIAAGGALTIGANAVEGSMLNDNAISGQTAETDFTNLGPDDELMISVDGSLKRADIKVLAQFLAGPGLTVADSGADEGKLLTQANNVQIFGDENKTLLEGMNAGSATLTADRTLTLPASPSAGDVVHVKAPASLGGNELIIQKGDAAHAIDGQASIQIESDGGAVSCMFIGSNTWVIY